jgi:hypothetical protein
MRSSAHLVEIEEDDARRTAGGIAVESRWFAPSRMAVERDGRDLG